jgi:hypothetical protein
MFSTDCAADAGRYVVVNRGGLEPTWNHERHRLRQPPSDAPHALCTYRRRPGAVRPLPFQRRHCGWRGPRSPRPWQAPSRRRLRAPLRALEDYATHSRRGRLWDCASTVRVRRLGALRTGSRWQTASGRSPGGRQTGDGTSGVESGCLDGVVIARARNIGHGHRLARAIVKVLGPHARPTARGRASPVNNRRGPDETNTG